MKLFKFLKTFLLNTCILVVSGFGQSVDINKIIKDEYKINTFKIINEMLQQILVDIKKEIDNINTK